MEEDIVQDQCRAKAPFRESQSASLPPASVYAIAIELGLEMCVICGVFESIFGAWGRGRSLGGKLKEGDPVKYFPLKRILSTGKASRRVSVSSSRKPVICI